MSIILHDEAYYKSRVPEPDLGPLENFVRFIWNPDRKTVLGRTGKEWGMLLLFYICFYAVLGSIFAIQMWISVHCASKLEEPYFTYILTSRSYFNNSLLFRKLNINNPGIDFKPNILLPTKSPIIWIDNSSMNARPKRYIEALNNFLQEYNKSKENYKTNAECSDEAPISSDMKPCFFDVKSLGVCGESPYGYTYPLQPCVLIKFNKKFNWLPIHYNKSSQLPENMPHILQEFVRSSNKLQIWLWCDGVNNVDKEHIGKIEYLPTPGFPVHYFPFAGQSDYLAPMVALQFKNITSFRLLTVECSLWALNINSMAQSTLDFQIILGQP
ncbi:hypothetical protein HN011_008595 [Eciton burchellii]|nr:hypothetical protein HN011_008595 [Eciton burchellii]